jgi:hypothetical protein
VTGFQSSRSNRGLSLNVRLWQRLGRGPVSFSGNVSNDIAEIWARIVAWLDDIVEQVPRPRLGEGEGRRWIRSS